MPSLVSVKIIKDYVGCTLNESMEIIDSVNVKQEYPKQIEFKKDFVDVEANKCIEFISKMKSIGWSIESVE